jgi:hypothetical protein
MPEHKQALVPIGNFDGEERRAERRLAWIKRGMVRRQGGVSTEVVLRDLSETGCCMSTNLSCEVGESFHLFLQGMPPILAKVIWIKVGEVGCRFEQSLQDRLVRKLTLPNF